MGGDGITITNESSILGGSDSINYLNNQEYNPSIININNSYLGSMNDTKYSYNTS